jgi:oligopeptide/dipeptide ABC transporter ATP-binding protein
MKHANSQSSRPPLLEVLDIRKVFASGGLFSPTRRIFASESISFVVDRGEAVALVGESGSGKSTIARLVLRLLRPDRGEIRLDGVNVLSSEQRRASLAYRGRVQMVFQDPFGSLNRVHNVAHHLIRPLLRHRRATGKEARAKAIELLRTVGLEPAEEFISRHPYELSGGQRQRVAIARALAVEPDLLVADEPTSMLDVSIRMGVLNLLSKLKKERGLAILFITHDLASARYLADRILVLFRGRVVEDGPSAAVVESPLHPYTQALLASIADTRVDSGSLGTSPTSDRPSEAAGGDTSKGCPFALRCPSVMDVCGVDDPPPRLFDCRHVRCHLYPQVAQEKGN